jgi:hypothetical protein
MGDIMTTSNPLDAATQGNAVEQSTKLERKPATSAAQKEATTAASPEDDSQLTKLSSVINGLKRGASVMRTQATQAMNAVRSGSYQVDPLQVSRRIVSDSLAWPN